MRTPNQSASTHFPRIRLGEIEDQSWCPDFLRDAMTDHLAALFKVLGPYDSILDALTRAVERTGDSRILDLCSGAGGAMGSLAPKLRHRIPDLRILLSDKFPNLRAMTALERSHPEVITSHAVPLDASDVPRSMEGFRTLFTSFHHFPPSLAEAILRDAVEARRGIAVFEVTNRTLRSFLSTMFVPAAVLAGAPFVKPTPLRLVLTYLIPLIPLAVLYDGLVSVLRSYSTEELKTLAESVAPDYSWEVGIAGRWIRVCYLVGVPGEH